MWCLKKPLVEPNKSSVILKKTDFLKVVSPVFSVCQLRACLGMEIVACGASIFNTILTLIKMEDMPFYCWHYYYDNTTIHYGETCHKVEVRYNCSLWEQYVLELNKVNIEIVLLFNDGL